VPILRGVKATARLLVVAVPLAAMALLGGCGDDDTGETVERLAEGTGARGVAEAMRLSLLAQDLGDDQHVDDVAVLRAAAEDLPGDPEIVGIEDGDGDGRDDDGRVEVRVDDEAACVTARDNGEVGVAGRGC
jgi:hypothetical protein